ncbi:TIGR04282 family arsenosugar biosynthesis glycosyltransferase [Xanthovirga aplysinae]|uniref:TIGR04282 family arsenosugar biosynthesis glycosyltransferase n=1 Tax=Xanthovirga aplysinae TaxID=2529853 RepID=UPI001656F26B|nr:DUF2064 domain-containing protein [Xanthovirga aplysinae]
MKASLKNTAILIFARSAAEEARNKTFVEGSSKQNLRISQFLLKQVQRTTRATGLPFFHLNENIQKGDTFGERLFNACQIVFDKGFGRVIVLGSDCPNITPKVLIDAAIALDNYSLVLGPSKDGGIYLLAADQEIFDKKHFLNIDWGSDQVFSQLLSWRKDNRSYCLPSFEDIDQAADLHRLFRHIRIPYNLLKLLEAFFLNKDFINAFEGFFNRGIKSSHSFGYRGPPLFPSSFPNFFNFNDR